MRKRPRVPPPLMRGAFRIRGSKFTGHVYSFSLSDELTISDDLRRVYDFDISDDLAVTEDFAELKSIPLTDALVISDVMSPAGSTWNRTIADVLTITDGFIVQTSRAARSCDLTPDGTISARDTIKLTWPYAAPSVTLELRNPEFGDVEDVTTQAQMARSRSGQLNPIRGAAWPTIRVLSFRFVALSEQQRDAFISFVEDSAADDVGLLDHYGRQWKGLLLYDAAEFLQIGRGCQYEASFKFRGVLV